MVRRLDRGWWIEVEIEVEVEVMVDNESVF